MGLEGAVKVGFRRELEAVEDPEERETLFNKYVSMAYEMGKAINMAAYLEIDSYWPLDSPVFMGRRGQVLQ